MATDSARPAPSDRPDDAGAPGLKITPEMRQAIFPGLVIPPGLTFENLERAGEMILEWQGDGLPCGPDDEFADDFRAVRLAAKLYEYLRAACAGVENMDFTKIDETFSREIVRGGETYLDGMLRVATSADQRASGLAGMFTAAATALIAAVVVLANPTWNVTWKLPLMLGGGAAALMFLTGAVTCLRTIMPVKFWLPGCEPHNWDSDVVVGKKLHDCLGERATHIQEQIADNLVVIETNARRFKRGARFGIAAPCVGFVVWLLLANACRFSAGWF
jgi:hypothetical protein